MAASPRSSRYGVRLFPDGVLIAALLAASAALLRVAAAGAAAAGSALAAPAGALLAAAGGLALLSLALILAYASSGTALWLSRAHLEPHSTPAATLRSQLRHRRSVGSAMPCPYPDAWYVVALSAELAVGDIVDATVCGRSLVVFRPAGGRPAALDAYCTHMGAHLAHGGGRLTEDGCIRCPFHGWCYDANGKLVRTETGDAPPAGSDLRAWPVMERNGVISGWMSAAGHRGRPPSAPSSSAALTGTAAGAGVGEGAAALDKLTAALEVAADAPEDERPWFQPPVFPELDSGAFVYHGCSEHIVSALLFELPENGSDVGHLTALHTNFVIAALRPLLSHKWAASWRADEAQPHLARLRIVESMVLLGVTLPGAVQVEITQVGPSQVFFSFLLPGVGRLAMIESVTPLAPTTQRTLHAIYAAPHVPRIVAKALLAGVVRAYEQDLPVWAHKRYVAQPRLTASEGAIAVYRRWVRQFIKSPQAISFADAQKAQLRLDLGLPEDTPLSW